MKRIGIFLAFTFTVTWGMAFTLMGMGGTASPYALLVFALFMLVPGLGVVFTRLVTREGFRDLWLVPHFRGNVKWYVAAWLIPPAAIALGAALYFILFPAQFDSNLSSVAIIAAQGGVSIPPVLYLLLICAQSILLAPILNAVTCLGEEFGWRGYLLPHLCDKMGRLPAALLTGAIWGVWHAPMIAMGHNYGVGYAGFPWLGIAAFIVYCTVVGGFFALITLKTRSCLPATFAHGAMNGFAAISVYLTVGTPSPFIGPLPVGIVGGSFFLLCGIISIIILSKEKKNAV
ncbi:MAG: CPBP family intramembrane glutamic endopeptidase [Clostridiaceae bacterium]|nr:CPBP family intramembrane glutamic endopeptidase [Clostridiaceae bacterium]